MPRIAVAYARLTCGHSGRSHAGSPASRRRVLIFVPCRTRIGAMMPTRPVPCTRFNRRAP